MISGADGNKIIARVALNSVPERQVYIKSLYNVGMPSKYFGYTADEARKVDSR